MANVCRLELESGLRGAAGVLHEREAPALVFDYPLRGHLFRFLRLGVDAVRGLGRVELNEQRAHLVERRLRSGPGLGSWKMTGAENPPPLKL